MHQIKAPIISVLADFCRKRLCPVCSVVECTGGTGGTCGLIFRQVKIKTVLVCILANLYPFAGRFTLCATQRGAEKIHSVGWWNALMELMLLVNRYIDRLKMHQIKRASVCILVN